MNKQLKKINISVFFPCYNEEGNLEDLVSKTLSFLPDIANKFEVIIVNDGSSDGTGEIADRLAKENSNVKVFHHPTNLGYGSAIKTGFINSQLDYIFFTDGDNQFDIRELEKFLPYTDEYDVVAGYRLKRRDNLIRSLNALGFNMFVRLLFGLKVRDLNCAFKIFKKKVIDSIDIDSTGAFINAEILISASKKNFKVTEIGVNHYPRHWGSQTGANIRVVLRAFYELFKLRKKLR